MRRWLLLLMIVLLLVRGWAAEAAAMPAGPALDCAEHSQSGGHHMAMQDGEPAPTACAGCPLLWALAPAFDTGAGDGTSFQTPRPASAPTPFASAERERRFKPPIS